VGFADGERCLGHGICHQYHRRALRLIGLETIKPATGPVLFFARLRICLPTQ
jgi:hypothetical protein